MLYSAPRVSGFGTRKAERVEMAMMYAAVATRSKYVVESRVVGIEQRQRPGFGRMRSNHVSRQLLRDSLVTFYHVL